MSRVYYQLTLSIRPENRDKAAKIAKSLFEMWEEGPDPEKATLSYHEPTGQFVFDTGDIVEISPALMDDTNISLTNIGNYAEKGAVVHHVYYGKRADFAVGPTREAREEAVKQDRFKRAVNLLEKVETDVPDEYREKIRGALTALRTLTS